MPKYLCRFSYSTEGLKGLLKDGGSKRRAAVAEAVKSVGAKLEVFYYTFGEDDGILILDAPDNVSAAAISLAVNASGVGRISTSVILTPEEIDAATKKSVTYHPPGH